MTNSFTVATREVPLVKALFPSYRKRDVRIVATTRVMFTDLNWSGGTRSEYHAVDLNNSRVKSFARWSMIAPWENPYEGASVDLIPGFAIIRTGHFCGKESVLTIYVHPENVTKYLPAA